MSVETKDLKYYLANPDEMPTDPKILERLANEHMDAALESGTEQLDVEKIVGSDETKGDSSGAAGKEEPKTEAKTEPEVTVDEPKVKAQAEPEAPAKPDGILAKDGKNVIPYSQLESARSRASAAEQLVKDQANEIARLKAEKTAPAAEPEMLTEDELAVLEEDQPTLAKTLRAQQASITKLNTVVAGMARRQNEDAVVQKKEVDAEIQSAIDANPTLAEWQAAEDQAMWNEAARQDQLLRTSPRYANVSFAQRFEKVVALTRLALDMEAPVEEVQETPATPTPAEVKAAAAAKLAAVNKAKKPLSMTDIPGGAPPAVDERAKVEEMSTVALGQQFLGMTKEQLDAYLATL